MIFNKRSFSVSIVFYLLCSSIARSLLAADNSEPNFAPGHEFSVDVNSRLAGIDHFMLYVPSDYNDKHDWPVIFFYPGQGGQPTTWPFRQITGGKGFVVVGMGYVDNVNGPMTEGQYINYMKRERKAVLETKKYISEHLKIDEKRLFITGCSKGGWHTSALLESSPKIWAGAVIFAAGRTKSVTLIATDFGRKALRGKPLYIGAGEQDTNLAAAKRAVEYYKRVGVKVTFEEYKGQGHICIPPDPKKLYDWLIANSSIKEAQPDLPRPPQRAQSAPQDKAGSAGR
jgi:predicted esterase